MLCPRFLQPLWQAWCSFSRLLGRIVSFILLGILWLTLFGLYGIALKIWNLKNIEKRKPATYWTEPTKDAGMEYQF